MTGAKDGYAAGGSGDDGGSTRGASGVAIDGGTADGGSGSDEVNGAPGTSLILDCGAGFDTYYADAKDTVRRCEDNLYN